MKSHKLSGAWEPGGSGGVGPPLESGIYVVKKISKNYSYLLGPPLDKNRSVAPEYEFARNQSCRMLELY